MNKFVKKLLVGVMAATMVLGSVTTAFAAGSPTEAQTPANQESVKAEDGTKVDTTERGNIVITSIPKTSKTSVSIPSKLEVDGVKYTVRRIEANAFKNAPKATKITLPSTITSLAANSFTGAKSVKTIAITSKTTVKVNKNAFKGVDTKKITVTVKVSSKGMSTKEYNAFVKALKKAGFKGTIKKVK